MKTTLLAVCGLSPQVITETLFALHQHGRRVDAVHLITTREGKDKVLTTLLDPDTGRYFQYLKEYGIAPQSIDFSPRNIHVITDTHGREALDIADESDNENLLRKCLVQAFHLTSKIAQAVYFSVAGGRKTMSACLTLAAQMYGRPRDRIYHVLVSPEFESSPEFYYPPRESRLIELKDKNGNPYFKETRYAEVNLIPLPFVSIRDRLTEEYLRGPLDPATLMASLIREVPEKLVVNLVEGKVVYRGMELDLMPARLSLYAFFALQKKECPSPENRCGDCTECYLDLNALFEKQPRISELYRRLAGRRPLEEMSDTGILNLNGDNFAMYKSKISKNLRDRFGLYAGKDLDIVSTGRRPNTRYGIALDREKIEIVF
jgi:CRISPR-associated protein (TIGR02584 family)